MEKTSKVFAVLVQIGIGIVFLCTLIVMSLHFSESKGLLSPGVSLEFSVVSKDNLEPNFGVSVWGYYDQVRLESSDPDLIWAKIITIVASGIKFVTFFIFLITAFVLAGRVKKQVPFAPVVRTGLWLVSLFTLLSAVVSPFLDRLAQQEFIRVVGLPTNGEGGTDWVAGNDFIWEYDIDWLLMALAVILAFVAYIYGKGEKLQDETKGLV